MQVNITMSIIYVLDVLYFVVVNAGDIEYHVILNLKIKCYFTAVSINRARNYFLYL